MTLPNVGFPSAVNMGTLEPVDYTKERSAATYVTDKLGYDCDDILEALGMLPYYGHDTRPNAGSNSNPRTLVIRPGTLR